MASDQAFVTLATNDSYGVGALVLGHSLRNSGTSRKLVILISPDVSASMRSLLSALYDVVQEVNVLDSNDASNLAILARPELGVTLTKLHAWNLTQFNKAVFLDADALVLQNVDELFEREELSAVPDVGWPDCFNTGVFVFRPSAATYDSLVKFALETGSFDGGDQGLLNGFFADWATKDINTHLSFIYNMVATAIYSYAPAFKRFGSNVKIVHFLGSTKPWHRSSPANAAFSPALGNFLDLWWSIFNTQVRFGLASSSGLVGLAAQIGQLNLGSSEHRAPFHRVAGGAGSNQRDWEAGNIDYLGEDRFENIQRRLQQSIQKGSSSSSSGPSQPQKSQPLELVEKAKETVQPVLGAAADALHSASSVASDAAHTTANVASSAVHSASIAASSAAQTASNVASGAGQAASNVASNVAQTAKDVGHATSNAAASTLHTASNVASNAAQTASNVASSAAQTASNAASSLAQGAKDAAAATIHTASNIASSAGQGAVNLASNAAESAKDAGQVVSHVASDAVHTASDLASSAGGVIADAASTAGGIASSAASGAVNAASSAAHAVVDAASSAASGAAHVASSAAHAVSSAAESVAEAVGAGVILAVAGATGLAGAVYEAASNAVSSHPEEPKVEEIRTTDIQMSSTATRPSPPPGAPAGAGYASLPHVAGPAVPPIHSSQGGSIHVSHVGLPGGPAVQGASRSSLPAGSHAVPHGGPVSGHGQSLGESAGPNMPLVGPASGAAHSVTAPVRPAGAPQSQGGAHPPQKK